MSFVIDGVGIAQRNGYRDVLVVQQLLNMNLGLLNRHHYLPLHPIDETGMFDRPTSELLRAYCRSVYPCGPTVIDAPAWATEIMHAVRMPGRANAGKSDAMGISRSGRFVGDLAAVSTTLLSLIRGALAWQSEYPAALADPALAALDANRIANFCRFRTVCQMRQSHELLALLKAVAPSISRSKLGPADAIARSVALAMALADIVSPLRKAAFLAQIATESDGFKAIREYASGDEYENRADLHNVLPGDGRRFAGRGYIQLTGRGNYTEAWRDIGRAMSHNDALKAKLKSDIDVPDPEYAETLEGAAKVTAWYWNKNKLNAIADKLSNVAAQESVLLVLSIAINGKNKKTGLPNGWEARKRYFKTAKRVMGLH